MKEIIYFLILFIFIVFLLFLTISYFIFGTPYSTEYNCKKIKVGDSLLSVIWQLGIPSHYSSEPDGTKVLGYPIPVASFADTPKNEVKLLNNKVVSKVCVFSNQ